MANETKKGGTKAPPASEPAAVESEEAAVNAAALGSDDGALPTRGVSETIDFSTMRIEDIDASLFDEEQIGFPPYWKPSTSCGKCKKTLGEKEYVCKEHPQAGVVGNRFFGVVLSRDVKQESNNYGEVTEFVRYVVVAACVHECMRGKTNEAYPVLVQAGEAFTVSEFSMLPLEENFGDRILVTTKLKRQHPTDPKKTLWEFGLRLDPSVKKLRMEDRISAARAAIAQLKANKNALQFTGGKFGKGPAGLAPLAPASTASATNAANAKPAIPQTSPEALSKAAAKLSDDGDATPENF